ncbi:SCY1-like protein 2 [Turdus rufiventris]|nr:SCY1-like protein 2 [Turdus rufiventris]
MDLVPWCFGRDSAEAQHRNVVPALLWIDPGLGQVDGMRLGAVKWLCASLLVLVPKGESQLGIVHNSGSDKPLVQIETMESMLNKLKSTVTKVTADVTSAVMGNPVTREFDVGRHIASGGNGLAWKIFNGTKKSTKQEVAVFVFDKKLIDKYQKFEKDQIIDSLKRGVQQLTRLRHPRLLTVQHPLEESRNKFYSPGHINRNMKVMSLTDRDCLAFCTEPVCASLANVLGSWDNLPSPLPSDIKEYKLYDVETKYGLLQPKFPCKEWDPNLPSLCLPNPEYLAPEYILSVSCETASDMYSLGAVMYAVFNKGKPIFEVNKQDIYKSFSRQLDQLSRLSSSTLQNIPEEVREHVKLLLNVAPAVRPDADQMTKIPFFDDVGAMTLQYFDSLFQRDNLQKSQFFKGLPKVLPKLPKRVIIQRILPCLTSEFVNPDMVPFVLPNVLLIAEECTKEEYIKLILPDLGPVFKQQEPIQILLIFLQKMDLLLTKTPPDEIKNSVLPMVYRALEAPSIQIQVRVNSLVCLGKILEYLDKWFVLDDILPFLQQIPSKEPAVLMGILGIYKCTFTHKKLGITKEQLAGKVLPHLIPLSIENNLNLNQFNSFICVIRDMLNRLEAEHKTKLEQLHVMQEQQKSLDIANQMSGSEEARSSGTGNQIDKVFNNGTDLLTSGSDSKENEMSAIQRKASLTLEEKQKLAKEQEQAQKLKSQQPLKPQATTVTPPVKQTKDLTDTLIDNMSSLTSRPINQAQVASSNSFSSVPSMGVGMGFSSPIDNTKRNMTNGLNTNMGFQTAGFTMGAGLATQNFFSGPSATGASKMNIVPPANMPNYSPMNAASAITPLTQQNRPPDMSALDNLFGPQKPKVSMKQLAQQKSSQWVNQFAPPPGSPNVSNTALGPQMNMIAQPGFGIQGNPFFSPQNFAQPANTMTNSSSASNDLKDLFG